MISSSKYFFFTHGLHFILVVFHNNVESLFMV